VTKHLIMKKHLTLLILFLSIFLSSYSQNNPEWINFLNGEYVSTFAEDNTNMWLGTNGGLVRINKTTGQKTFYNKANSELPFNSIYSSCIDKYGNLWIGSYARLAKFDGQNWTDFNVGNSNIVYGAIDCITSDLQGNIWMGTHFKGIQKYDGQSFTTYLTFPNGSSNVNIKEVTDMTVDTSGLLWCTTFCGVVSYDGVSSWNYLSNWCGSNNLPMDDLTSITTDYNGKLWIASSYNPWGSMSGTGGVSYYQNGSWHVLQDSAQILKSVFDITFDQAGNLYAATLDYGIVVYNGSHFKVWNKNILSCNSNQIYHVYYDNNGYLWFSTRSALYKRKNNITTQINTSSSNMPTNRWSSFVIKNNLTKYGSYISKHSSLSLPSEYSIIKMEANDTIILDNTTPCSARMHYEDTNGVIWIPGTGGIIKIVDTTINLLTPPTTVTTCIHYYGITADSSGKLLIACDDGLLSFDGINWAKEANFPGSCSNIVSVYIDSTGIIWAGSNGCGIASYKNNNWTSYNFLNNSYISKIAEDKNHNIWFASLDNGMAKYTNNTWQIYDHTNSSLPSYGSIFDFIFDKNNKLYVASYGDGVRTYDGQIWDSLTSLNSELPFDNIWMIKIDNLENIWFISEWEGIAVYRQGGVIFSNDGLFENEITTHNILVYPNPSNKKFNIEFNSSLTEDVLINVYDLSGRIIFNKYYKASIGVNKIEIDASYFNQGVYILNIKSQENLYKEKLIIY